MTTMRRRPQLGASHTEKPAVGVPPLEQRRRLMHAAEGHAGSIPRGNQEPEHENLGRRHDEWDRVLGH